MELMLIEVLLPNGSVCYGNFYKSKQPNPKGNIMLVHGMAEYSSRYLPFMRFLAENGYNVYAVDHIGHGLQVSKKEGANYGVWPKDGFDQCVEQIYALALQIRKENNLPIIIFGHSLGSFITQAFYQRHSEVLQGVVVCGSGFNNPTYRFANIASNIFAPFYKKEKGEKVCKFFVNTGTSSFNKKVKKTSECPSSNRWLSYSLENIKAYDEDPECGFDCSFNFYYSMFHGQQTIWKKSSRDQIKNKVKMLIIAGEDDPVGDYSKGILKLYKFYQEIQKEKVQMILYPKGRHEILNEDFKEVVYQDVLKFLDSITL